MVRNCVREFCRDKYKLGFGLGNNLLCEHLLCMNFTANTENQVIISELISDEFKVNFFRNERV